MKNKILLVGSVTSDTIITPIEKFQNIGGPIYFQTHTLSNLEQDFLSVVFVNPKDSKIIEEFPLDTKIIPKNKTACFINIYDENQNRIQKTSIDNESITIKKLEKLDIDYDSFSTVILSPIYMNDIPSDVIKYFKDKDITTVVLPQGYLRIINKDNQVELTSWKDYEKYLKYIDIICLDKTEYLKAFNKSDLNSKSIYNLIKKFNLKLVIITLSDKGSLIFYDDNFEKIDAIKTDKIVDPTGLGDTYIAAFITEFLKDSNIKKSGIFASIVCKEKIKTKGPIKTKKDNLERMLILKLKSLE